MNIASISIAYSASPNPHPSSGSVSVDGEQYSETRGKNAVMRCTYWWRKSSLLGDDDAVDPENRDSSTGTEGKVERQRGIA